MSTHVADILTQANVVALATLGAPWKKLRYPLDVLKNSDRDAAKAVGIRPLSAAPAETPTRAYVLDQLFEVILTDSMRRSDDDETLDTLGVLYDKADELFKAFIQTKINLATTVFNIDKPSLSEPEIYRNEKIVVLRMVITVKYRSLLN